MKTFIRDSTVRLKFNFFDVDGNAVDPATAQVSISYCPHTSGDPTCVTYPLTQESGTDDWVYEWDSSIAAAGVISVHAETTDGQPVSSVDSEFRLRANRANRQETGDWGDAYGYP